jgi:hypothetical protein
MKIRQSYNNKIDKWVKYKIYENGKSKIVKVKKSNPTKKFKNVRVQ